MEMIRKFRKSTLRLVPAWFMNLWQAYGLRKNPYYKRIDSLPIDRCGLLDDGMPYIQLTNGRIFYGNPPTAPQRYFYRYFLGIRIKDALKEDCINVAFDIIVRYFGPDSAAD